MRVLHVLLILAPVALSACESRSASGAGNAGGTDGLRGAEDDVPATIVDPTPESRAELRAAVSQAMGSADVTLADDALTGSSVLLIEHGAHGNLEHGRIMGRDPGSPVQFRLVERGDRCILIDVASGARQVLTRTRCTPE